MCEEEWAGEWLDGCLGAGGVGLGLDASNAVTELRPGSPAAKSEKFIIGDVVVSVDGITLSSAVRSHRMFARVAHTQSPTIARAAPHRSTRS